MHCVLPEPSRSGSSLLQQQNNLILLCPMTTSEISHSCPPSPTKKQNHPTFLHHHLNSRIISLSNIITSATEQSLSRPHYLFGSRSRTISLTSITTSVLKPSHSPHHPPSSRTISLSTHLHTAVLNGMLINTLLEFIFADMIYSRLIKLFLLTAQ